MSDGNTESSSRKKHSGPNGDASKPESTSNPPVLGCLRLVQFVWNEISLTCLHSRPAAITTVVSSITTVISLCLAAASVWFAYVPIRQWQAEGAVFTLTYVTEPDQIFTDKNLSTGATAERSNHAMVVTNSGRTQGTIIAIKQAEMTDAREVVCVPDVSEDGRILTMDPLTALLPNTDGHEYSLSGTNTTDGGSMVNYTEITLQPGESRLVLLSGMKTSGNEVPTFYDGAYTLYTADGKKKTVEPSNADDTYSGHYAAIINSNDAVRKTCGQYADMLLQK